MHKWDKMICHACLLFLSTNSVFSVDLDLVNVFYVVCCIILYEIILNDNILVVSNVYHVCI